MISIPVPLDTEEHIYNNVTSIIIEEPINEVIINSSDETIYKKQKKGTDNFVVIAPGENKVPRYVTFFCILSLYCFSVYATKYHIFPKN